MRFIAVVSVLIFAVSMFGGSYIVRLFADDTSEVYQIAANRADELIGVGLFAARVGKQDQVNGDFVLVKSNKNGGAVRAAAKGYDIDSFTSNFS